VRANGIVTLTTDFDVRDSYAGVMRGAVLSVNPRASVVDITHGIPAHNILHASFTLANAIGFFPEGTIHCAVVDPGVGGKRKDIAIRTPRYFFVGPDNGIFSIAVAHEKDLDIREVKNPAYIRGVVSKTFHGRDIFAPCAGMLSKGASFTDVGPPLKTIEMLSYPEPVVRGGMMTGVVLSVDSFGNMVTNIKKDRFRPFIEKHRYEIYFATERFDEVSETYEDKPPGTPLVVIGSAGYLEISMSSGNAADYFMASVGSTISVRRF